MSPARERRIDPAVICFAVAALGLFLRAPHALLTPQPVGEDATVYFAEQLGHAVPQLFAPLQGYLVVVPRLVAWIASAFGAGHFPVVCNFAVTLLDALAIAYFCHRARALFHPYASLSVILLLPLLNGEIFGILANMQWFTQLALVAACLLPRPDRPTSAGWRTVEAGALLAIALTGPFAVLCSFVYVALLGGHAAAIVFRLKRIRSALSDYLASVDDVALAVVAGAGLLTVWMAAGHGANPSQHSAHALANFFNIVVGASLQAHLFGVVLLQASWFLPVLAFLLVALVVGRTEVRSRVGCLVLLAYGWLCLGAGYLKMDAYAMPPEAFGYIDRYMFALAVTLWLVAWRMAADWLPGGKVAGTCLVVGTLAGLGVAHPIRLRNTPPRDLDWPAYAGRIDAGESVEVPINPVPWMLHVPRRQHE